MSRSTPKTRKKAVNVSIREDLAAEAKARGTNLSQLLEEALTRELKTLREAAWREENRTAIEDSNRELDRNGLWADKFRTW